MTWGGVYSRRRGLMQNSRCFSVRPWSAEEKFPSRVLPITTHLLFPNKYFKEKRSSSGLSPSALKPHSLCECRKNTLPVFLFSVTVLVSRISFPSRTPMGNEVKDYCPEIFIRFSGKTRLYRTCVFQNYAQPFCTARNNRNSKCSNFLVFSPPLFELREIGLVFSLFACKQYATVCVHI